MAPSDMVEDIHGFVGLAMNIYALDMLNTASLILLFGICLGIAGLLRSNTSHIAKFCIVV